MGAGGIMKAASELGLVRGPSLPLGPMRLHVSLAWTTADPRPSLTAAEGSWHFQESCWGRSWSPKNQQDHADTLEAPTSALHVRIGDRTTTLQFPFSGRTTQ